MFRRMATRRGFEEFWREYCEGRAERDEGWKGLPSPYDCGRVGRGYERLGFRAGNVEERMVGKAEADLGDEMTMRTEGLVTRGLARKREVAGEADGGGRRRRESEEASSDVSDVLPPAKRRRIRCVGKVSSSQLVPRDEEG